MNEQLQTDKRSCLSRIYGLLMSAGFVLITVFIVTPLVVIQATADFTVFAYVVAGLCFFWQRRTARKSFLKPPMIMALFLLLEVCSFSLLPDVYHPMDLSKQTRVRMVLAKYAEWLNSASDQTIAKVGMAAKDLYSAGSASLQAAFDSLGSDDRSLVRLEEAFSDEPGNPAVVLALADAYMARNDLASTRLAIALYEALVETGPSDTFLARLAEAYSRIYRYDLAFATAVKRTWLPHAMMHRAARQIAFLAVASGDLSRGIFELENILRLDPVESDEIILLLAGLYQDVGNKEKAREILGRLTTATPATTSATRTAAQLLQTVQN
jgi:tetratricopeptide (TPR) repeat protein